VSHTLALPFYIKKSISRQKKKNYENSNYFTKKKTIIFQNKSSKRDPNPSRYYNSATKFLKFQVSTQAKNIIFQKSSYKNK